MTIALNHLCGHWSRLQAKPLADALFVLRLQVPEGANRAGKFANAHAFGRSVEPLQIAPHFGVPVQKLQAKCRRLRVDAVRAADCRRVLELERAPLENAEKSDETFPNDRRSFLHLKCL